VSEDEVNQPANPRPIVEGEAQIGKLIVAMVSFIVTAGGAALYVWWDLDDLLAGRFILVPTLIAAALIGAFFALVALWGKFLNSQIRVEH
jgi:hypothetical protein